MNNQGITTFRIIFYEAEQLLFHQIWSSFGRRMQNQTVRGDLKNCWIEEPREIFFVENKEEERGE